MAVATIDKLSEQIDKAVDLLEKSAKPSPAVGLFNGRWQEAGKDPGWPSVERVEQMAKAYGNGAMASLMAKGGRSRVSGWGPGLAKMAAIQSPAIASRLQIPANYGFEQLEKEFGITKAAMAEGSGVTGGYLVPPQWVGDLQRIQAEEAFFEPRAMVMPMTSRTMTIPTLDITTAQATGTAPYFGGVLASWQPEAATINETEPAWKQTEWTAWDLVLYSVSSAQLLQDNGIGLDAFLTQIFAEAMTYYSELAFLSTGVGAGSNMPLSVKNAPATYVQSRGTGSTFKYADACAMFSRLQPRSWDKSIWVAHPSTVPQFAQMIDNSTNSMLVWLNPIQSGTGGPSAVKLPNAFFNGLPLFFSDKMSVLGTKGDVMLLDPSQYIIGKRLDIQIAVSDQYLFRTNQLAWRVVARMDGRPWLSGSIVDQAGWTSSPFVCLNT